jgi:hypothetical protein
MYNWGKGAPEIQTHYKDKPGEIEIISGNGGGMDGRCTASAGRECETNKKSKK